MLNSTVKRRSHYDPAPLPGVTHRDTPRRALILSLLGSYRLLRTTHVLEFCRYYLGEDISEQQTLRCLRDLMDERLIIRVKHDPDSKTVAQGSLPKIHGLNIRRNQALNERPQAVTQVVPHTLAIDDTMAFAVVRACRQSAGRMHFRDAPDILRTKATEQTRASRKPYTWTVPVLFDGKELKLSLTPDRLFGMRFTGVVPPAYSYLTLEEDLSTEPQQRKEFQDLINSSIFRKMLGYIFGNYLRIPHTLYGIERLRVLFVTDSKKRVTNMLAMWKQADNALREFQKQSGLDVRGCPKNAMLFIDRPTLRAGTIFTVPWINCHGEEFSIPIPAP